MALLRTGYGTGLYNSGNYGVQQVFDGAATASASSTVAVAVNRVQSASATVSCSSSVTAACERVRVTSSAASCTSSATSSAVVVRETSVAVSCTSSATAREQGGPKNTGAVITCAATVSCTAQSADISDAITAETALSIVAAAAKTTNTSATAAASSSATASGTTELLTSATASCAASVDASGIVVYSSGSNVINLSTFRAAAREKWIDVEPVSDTWTAAYHRG